MAGTLSMASMRSTGGSGEAYVDLTAQVGPFHQDTARGTYAIDGTTVSEANEWYSNLPSTTGGNPSDSNAAVPGVRYVYNVADTLLPDYNGAKMIIGFDNQANGTKSVLCNGDDASTITAQGFLPLTTGSGAPSGSDAAGSTCREFAGLELPESGFGAVLDDTDLRPQKLLSNVVLAPVVWAPAAQTTALGRRPRSTKQSCTTTTTHEIEHERAMNTEEGLFSCQIAMPGLASPRNRRTAPTVLSAHFLFHPVRNYLRIRVLRRKA